MKIGETLKWKKREKSNKHGWALQISRRNKFNSEMPQVSNIMEREEVYYKTNVRI